MQCEIGRTLLAEMLTAAFGAAAAKHANNLVTAVKLSANDGSIRLTGTDTEMELQVSGSAVVQEHGDVLLSSRLQAICREAVGDNVTLSVENGGKTLRVVCGHGAWKLQVPGDPKEFPAYPDSPAKGVAKIKATDLRRGFRLTDFACDPASVSYALGGVQMDFDTTNVTLAATDSRRLAVLKVALEGDAEVKDVVPLKAIKQLERLLVDGDVTIVVRSSHIEFRGEGWSFRARYIEGKFPRWEDLLSAETRECGGVDLRFSSICEPFARAFRSAAICTANEKPGIRISLASGEATFESDGADIGQSKVSIPVQYEGENVVSWTFDPKYILEFLKRVDPAGLIEVSADEEKWYIHAEGATYVVMSMAQQE